MGGCVFLFTGCNIATHTNHGDDTSRKKERMARCEVKFNSIPLIVSVVVLILVAVVVSCACVGKTVSQSIDDKNSTFFQLHLSGDETNLAIIFEGNIGSHDMIWQLDTGYAGAPVISSRYLAAEVRNRKRYSKYRPTDRYDKNMELMGTIGKNDEDFVRVCVDEFISTQGCTEYTAGCSVNTISIAARSMKHSQLIMCRCMELQTVGGRRFCVKRATTKKSGLADVFMISDIKGPHIMTMDYMTQIGPVVLWMRERRMEVCKGLRKTWLRSKFDMKRLHLNGGSPIVSVRVGGIRLRCVLDTGATVCMSINRNANRPYMSHKRTLKKITQLGINNEYVCSDVITTTVVMCNKKFVDVPIVVTDVTDDVDGYIGMGLLRCFDIMFTSSSMGMRYNGVSPVSKTTYLKSAQSGECASSTTVH